MKLIEDEHEAETQRKKLEEEMKQCLEEGETKITKLRINWKDELNNWEDAHARNLGLVEKRGKVLGGMFFVASSKDKIKGKPQLVDIVKKRIVLLREISKIERYGGRESAYIHMIKWFNEKYDARYDGVQKDVYALDFWVYKIIDENNLEYFMLSEEKLPNEVCEFSGMAVPVDDITEITKSMKVKSLSRIFFVKEFEPMVKVVDKEELLEVVDDLGFDEDSWIAFLGFHPNGNINKFPHEVELLRSAWLLSSKVDGYPLHLAVVGRAGTRKTMGHIETLANKFSEQPEICEGAGSTLKGLTPSFKEKPANIGFMARSDRVGWIDEIGKMIEKECNKHQQSTGNYLGDLNFLLEHKNRVVGSGNDNECQIQATAKFMFVTNPITKKDTLQQHVGLLDPSFMSRILWWVQDYEESDFVMGDGGIREVMGEKEGFPPHYVNTNTKYCNVKLCVGGSGNGGSFLNLYPFLTIFDTCNSFLSKIDPEKIKQLVKTTSNLAQEPMKSQVWKPRATHHIKLLLDGLCKHRCLFIDKTTNFEVNEVDYANAELILYRMVKSWDTNFHRQNPFNT